MYPQNLISDHSKLGAPLEHKNILELKVELIWWIEGSWSHPSNLSDSFKEIFRQMFEV